jgi:urease accessory protein UreH
MSPETAAPLQIPHQSHPANLGRMSDYSYSGTLLIVADQFTDWRPVVSALRAELESLPEVLGGVSLLTHSGCSARYLAKSAIPFQSATHRLWTAARRQVLHLPPLDLRKY